MTLLKDEFLVAYADDELCTEHKRRISLALLKDERAIDAVVKFKVAAEFARQAISWPAIEPVQLQSRPARAKCTSICCDLEQALLSQPCAEPKNSRIRGADLNSRRPDNISQPSPDWSRPMNEKQNVLPPDDETLIAFSDGLLDGEAEERVARYLETDAAARDFVERLIRSREIAKGAYDEALSVPSPASLIEMIQAGSSDHGPSQSNVISFKSRKKAKPTWALPLAACLTLMVGGLVSFQLGRPAPTEPVGIVAVGPAGVGTPVSQLLATKLTGDPVSVESAIAGSTTELTVLATFQDQAGRVCREFEVIETKPTSIVSSEALACRTESGGWYVEAVAARMAPTTETETFTPASGGTSHGLAEVLKSIGAGPALTRADEEQLLKRGWDTSNP